MDYFNILNLAREPFSNSPDPEFFFQSRQHQDCLQKLEIALRLKRGLNVVIGEVGTGKTTLCRQLIRKFADDDTVETHLILDPDIPGSEAFLATVAEMVDGRQPGPSATPWELKETIKNGLYRKGVEEGRTVILIIDEGQKLPADCIEMLREFLNFETNAHKLLQIAIFAQTEFEAVLDRQANFADRINLLHRLGPMNFRDTREMIRYRIHRSLDAAGSGPVFTLPALAAIYRASGGYPRKIIHICHQCLLAVIIQNRSRVGWRLVRSCVRRRESTRRRIGWWAPAAGVLAIAVIGLTLVFTRPLDSLAPPRQASGPPAAAPLDAAPTAAVAPVRPQTDAMPAADIDAAPDADNEPPAAVAAAVPSADPAPPEILGVVTLQKRETIWRLVEKVYGTVEPRYLWDVLSANPQIADPKRVEVGDRVVVPAIPMRTRQTGTAMWWVRIGETASLEAAVDMLRQRTASDPPARLVPTWNPQDGLRFSVLLRTVFTDAVTARDQCDRLRETFGTVGEVVTAWAPESVFYADPYRPRPRMQ